MELFRPTGLQELALVLQRDLAAWPPRLPEQPIFYPVLNLAYATQIARDWNTKSEAQAGYVTRFEVDDAYASRFPRKVVGGRQHEELWVPSEELDEFNNHICRPIQVVAAFFGPDFQGIIPASGSLCGRNARDQLRVLADQYARSSGDLREEVIMNRGPPAPPTGTPDRSTLQRSRDALWNTDPRHHRHLRLLEDLSW